MFPIQEFEKRFQEILNKLDELKDAARDDTAEALEEMNADFEDALFVIESIGEDEDWREAFEDALAEFEDLCDGYLEQTDVLPELGDVVKRLEMAIQMAKANLQ